MRMNILGFLKKWTVYSLCVGAAAAMAQSSPTMITWMLWDSAPGTISSNGKPVDGYYYQFTKMLSEAWPEAQHRLVLSSTKSATSTLNEGLEACTVNTLMTTERMQKYYMTQTFVLPPLTIIARPDSVSKLPRKANGEVDPAALFDSTELRGVLAINRSYATLLDGLLKSRSPSAKISFAEEQAGKNNILQMIALDRGDYTIEYAASANYQASLVQAVAQGDLKSIPIAGLEPLPVGIACPRTPWGRAVIRKADKLLTKLVKRPDYFDALKRWQTSEVQNLMLPYEKKFITQRSMPTDPAFFGPP